MTEHLLEVKGKTVKQKFSELIILFLLLRF
jgi:hypothetical protein